MPKRGVELRGELKLPFPRRQRKILRQQQGDSGGLIHREVAWAEGEEPLLAALQVAQGDAYPLILPQQADVAAVEVEKAASGGQLVEGQLRLRLVAIALLHGRYLVDKELMHIGIASLGRERVGDLEETRRGAEMHLQAVSLAVEGIGRRAELPLDSQLGTT